MHYRKLLTLASVLCVGCSATNLKESPAQLSFEKLGSDFTSRGDSLGHENRTVINVSGMGLPVGVGQTVTSPGRANPDLLALPVSATCSRVVVTKYDTDATYDDVKSVSEKIDEIADEAAEIGAEEVKLVLIEIALSKALSVDAQAFSNDISIRSIAGSVGAASVDSAGFTKAKTDALQKKLAAMQKVTTLRRDLRGLLGKKNIIVSRWSGDNSDSGGLSVGSIVSVDGKGSSAESGFVVMAGIRDVSLQLGRDFITRLKVEGKQFKSGRYGDDVETIFGDPYVVTFSRSAQYVKYSRQLDAAAALALKLQLSPEQITTIGGEGLKALLAQQSFQVGYAVSAAIAASNQGGLSTPSREAYEYRFWAREVRSRSLELESKRGQGYGMIYYNRADIIKARDRIGEASAEADECMHVVPKSGAVVDSGIERLGDEFCLPIKEGNWSDKTWRSWRPDINHCINLGENILSR